MYYNPCIYIQPRYANQLMYNNGRHFTYWNYPTSIGHVNRFDTYCASNEDSGMLLRDYGMEPFVINIKEATNQNNTFRTALWTGNHLQLTVMSIGVGEDIGFEVHHDVDQFLRIEQGQGIVQMGKSKNNLNFERTVCDDSAIIIPAGTWHNVKNTGSIPLKLYSIYAPPSHPYGTVHTTKADE